MGVDAGTLYPLPSAEQYPPSSPAGDARLSTRPYCLCTRLPGNPSANFEEWLRRSFGEGIARYFMLPYNWKVWAYPPSELAYNWIGERVAQVDLERIIFNILDARDDTGWGPNNRFRFPLQGGTGEIWRRLARTLPDGALVLGKAVEHVDTERKRITFSDGSTDSYDVLISTMPVDELVQRSNYEQLKPAAAKLLHSATHVIGVGLKGSPGPDLGKKCWIYFPESHAPFYRVTLFSHYSPSHVPDPARFWSLMAEVSESPVKAVDGDKVVEQSIAGMLATHLIENPSDVVSTWHYRAGHGYPTPSLDRDEVLRTVLPALEEKGIFSRGRFGAWKYEVSNQDHSLMQGVELVDRLTDGSKEVTLHG